jgi:integrase
VIKDNVDLRETSITTATPTAKGIRSSQQNYNSNITIRLWPFTCLAIDEYIRGERDEVLSQRLVNLSKSFLFLTESGTEFKDRTSITAVFSRLRAGLKELDLLNTADGDPFARGKHYEFTAYTLRHSAATLFYAVNQHQPDVKDQMRMRFGWTAKSASPDLYANRAMSEAASVDMMQFHEKLLQDLATKRYEGKHPSVPKNRT